MPACWMTHCCLACYKGLNIHTRAFGALFLTFLDAGMRIDPEGFCRSRLTYYTGISLAPFTDSLTLPFTEGIGLAITGVPDGYGINDVSWSPDSKYVAFTARLTNADPSIPRPPAELWLAEASSGKARRLVERGLNSIFEECVILFRFLLNLNIFIVLVL